jgi:hypothetical protein
VTRMPSWSWRHKLYIMSRPAAGATASILFPLGASERRRWWWWDGGGCLPAVSRTLPVVRSRSYGSTRPRHGCTGLLCCQSNLCPFSNLLGTNKDSSL